MLEINKTYTFDTIAPTILGSNLRNLKVIAITTSTEAVKYDDIYTRNAQIRSIVTNNLPDVNAMVFAVFTNPVGDKIVLSTDWIVTNSITEVTSTDIKLTVRGIRNIDVQTISNVLHELGFVNLDIEILNT